MGEQAKMRRGKRLIAGGAAVLALLPAACTDGGNESGPKSATATSEAFAPPVKSFEELTRRTAEAITCMLTSDKTRLIPSNENDGGLISVADQPAARLQAARYLPPKSLGAWRGDWMEPGDVPGEEVVMAVTVEAFVPPDSPYWQDPQLTRAAVQAGVRDMKGYYLSTAIVPFEVDSDGFDAGAMSYSDRSFGPSPAERDPGMLSTADSSGKWRPATEEDVQRLERDVNQVLSALMTESQITDCLARP